MSMFSVSSELLARAGGPSTPMATMTWSSPRTRATASLAATQAGLT